MGLRYGPMTAGGGVPGAPRGVRDNDGSRSQHKKAMDHFFSKYVQLRLQLFKLTYKHFPWRENCTGDTSTKTMAYGAPISLNDQMTSEMTRTCFYRLRNKKLPLYPHSYGGLAPTHTLPAPGAVQDESSNPF